MEIMKKKMVRLLVDIKNSAGPTPISFAKSVISALPQQFK